MGFGWVLALYCVGAVLLIVLSELAIRNTRGERDPWGRVILPVYMVAYPAVWFALYVFA